jgi:protein-tyrosine phosphatase
MLTGPVTLTSANRSGQPDPVTAEDVVASLGSAVNLVLDDGRSRFAQPSSVVQVGNNSFKVLREGVVSKTNLKRLSSLFILMVCTGNTCRSPMAETLARKLIGGRLGCEPDEVGDHGVMVASAGLAAMVGGRASPQAVDVMAAAGLDLSQHETQPLTEQLVRHADVILTMTRSHREAVLTQWPDAAPRTKLLSPNNIDVCDPIGGPRDEYQRCAEQIQTELMSRVAELELSASRDDRAA